MRNYRPTGDGIFRFKINGNTLKEDGDGSLILGICAYNEENGYFFTGYGDQYTVMSIPDQMPVEVPASATIHHDWAMKYYDVDDLENARLIDVAIDGNDYYVKGMFSGLPEAWVKGIKDGDKVVFDNYQLFGADLSWNYFVYLAGGNMYDLEGDMFLDDAEIESEGLVFTINNEGILEADNWLIFITSPDTNPENANYVEAIGGIEIREHDPSTFTNPLGPDEIYLGGWDGSPAIEFNLPPIDENGNTLDVNKLYFSAFANSQIITFDPDIYIDLWILGIYEPTTELPYNIGNGYDLYQAGAWHTVYIYPDEELYNIGIQSIYYPEGRDVNPDNVLKSNIIMVGDNPNNVDGVVAGKEIKSETLYNLNGQQVAKITSGIYMKRIEYSDGTVKTMKIIHK